MKTKSHMHYLALGYILFTFMPQAMGAAPGDILFEREDQSEVTAFPPSIFIHWRHRIHYRCDACHDSLFKMEQGATLITMDLMNEGKVCGACHNGQLAFDDGFGNCARCHRAPSD